jgi:hypothetical protein
MRFGLVTALIACVASLSTPAFANLQFEPVTARNMTPAVAKAIAISKSRGLKLLVCAEIDDQRAGGEPIFRIDMVGQFHGKTWLLAYSGPDLEEIAGAISDDEKAHSKDGWRRIVIVVDQDVASVRHEPWPGPIETAQQRVVAEVDRTFPGHTVGRPD